ncbi:MAG: PEP-utilizing enzyme [Candidatus Micrarchaeota archaeon]
MPNRSVIIMAITPFRAKWWFCEEVFPLAPIAMEAHYVGFSKPAHGEGFTHSIMFFNGTHALLYWDADDCRKVGEIAKRLVLDDRGFIGKLRRETIRASNSLMAFNRRVSKLNLKSLDDGELIELLTNYSKLHAMQSSYGSFPNTLDYYDQMKTNPLSSELESLLSSKGLSAEEITHAISVLTFPSDETFPMKEQKAFMKLASSLSKNKGAWGIFAGKESEIIGKLERSHPGALRLVDKHVGEFSPLSFLFIGPVKWTRDYYISLISSMARGKLSPGLELKKLVGNIRKIMVEKRRLEMQLNGQEKHLAYVASQMAFLKIYRKDAQTYGWFSLHLIAREAAARIGLLPGQANFLLPSELISCLEGRKPDAGLIASRMKQCAYVLYKGKFSLVTGKDAATLGQSLASLHKIDLSSRELQGVCACPGFAKGAVKIINQSSDMGKMNRGDVLVAHTTQPEIVLAMKKASAIVTDMGGLTSHAAIVSRELGVPCIIGTKIATKVLKDGDKVEVDATKGTVRKISQPESTPLPLKKLLQ